MTATHAVISGYVDATWLRYWNYSIFQEGVSPYFVPDPLGGDDGMPPEAVARAIFAKTSDAELDALIEAVPPFRRDELRQAWSHWMALVTIQQPFPDGNHRTAMAAFDEVCIGHFGVTVALGTVAARDSTAESRPLILGAHGNPGYPATTMDVASLADPDHPMRTVYRRWEHALKVQPAAQAGKARAPAIAVN